MRGRAAGNLIGSFAAAALLLASCTGTVDPPRSELGTRGGPRQSSVASESGARRLTTAELDRALAELLGDGSGVATRTLPADSFIPFDNNYPDQVASEALITSLEIMATDVTDSLLADPARRDAVVGCTPSGPGDAVCFRSFVESFLPRAFRRPLEPGEADAYVALQAFSTEDIPEVNNDFYSGIALVIRAVLIDPEFLYRIETGMPTSDPGVFALSDYELATRLSFLLWGTVPDDALLNEAAAGRLVPAASRRTTAEGMLDDPRARAQIQRFHRMWLGYRVLPHDAALVSEFENETNALLDRIVFDEPQSYENLFTFQETHLTDALADHYGLPRPDGGEGWVAYGDSGRAGILSHGTLLASFAKFADTSPTQRGILIQERLMCRPIPPPPPSIDVDDPPGDPVSDCKWDRYAAHRERSGCTECHSLMDPIGFGLENYDMAGRYREHDDGQPDCAIEGVGELPGHGSFQGPAELGQLLVEAGYITDCFTEQFLTFAGGRAIDASEESVLQEVSETFEASRFNVRSFLLGFVASDRFAKRREERL